MRRLQHFGYPAFVKPVGQEASDGIAKASFVRDEKEAVERLRFLHQKFNSDAMIEEYIEGRELYACVPGERIKVAFPPREIFSVWSPTMSRSSPLPAPSGTTLTGINGGITNGPAADLPEPVAKDLRALARNVYSWLRIRGFGRIDVRLSRRNELFVIEANPNPSLAAGDDFAQSANAEGLNYDALIQEILNAALC